MSKKALVIGGVVLLLVIIGIIMFRNMNKDEDKKEDKEEASGKDENSTSKGNVSETTISAENFSEYMGDVFQNDADPLGDVEIQEAPTQKG